MNYYITIMYTYICQGHAPREDAEAAPHDPADAGLQA